MGMVALEQDLVWYLTWRSNDYGTPVTKTRLVKYVYLVDLIATREQRERATRLDWLFYHYGPYTMELEPLVEREEAQGHVRTQRLRSRPDSERSPVMVYPVGRPPEDRLPRRIRAIADDVCNRWTDATLNELLNFVYFETPPMRDARRGEALDLLTDLEERWPRPPRRQALPAPEVSEDAKERMREIIRRRRAEPRATVPPPNYDEGYATLLRLADASDESDLTGISGTINLSDDAPEDT
jgi:hypothetical protein